MIKLGERQKLLVVKTVGFGVYLAEREGSAEKVLLPKKQVPEGTKLLDTLDVFIYKDSMDRVIATTRKPKLALHRPTVLEVAEVGAVGAFLDWGLEKDLLLPYKEQTLEVKPGERYLVALYIDKSKRLCATMRVYSHLRQDSPYRQDDRVTGTVYDVSETYGVYVGVDNLYSGRIPPEECRADLKIGDQVEVRVSGVKEDGKLDLSFREKAYLQMDADAAAILEEIEKRGGALPFNDKASPEQIKETFHMSKNAFKRGVGRLLKEGKIRLEDDGITIL